MCKSRVGQMNDTVTLPPANAFKPAANCLLCRLEDLCEPETAAAAVRTMLQNARLPFDDSVVQRAVEQLESSKCHTGYWRVGVSTCVHSHTRNS